MNTSTKTTKKSLVDIFNNAPAEVQHMARVWYDNKHSQTLDVLLMKQKLDQHTTKEIARTLMTAFNVFISRNSQDFNTLYSMVEGEAA